MSSCLNASWKGTHMKQRKYCPIAKDMTLAERREQDLLSIEQLCLFGIRHSRATIYRMIRRGEFPPPIKISPGRVAFVREDIAAWIKGRIAERDEAA
jgi:prophage regulatory protein